MEMSERLIKLPLQSISWGTFPWTLCSRRPVSAAVTLSRTDMSLSLQMVFLTVSLAFFNYSVSHHVDKCLSNKHCWNLSWALNSFLLGLSISFKPEILLKPGLENFEHYFASIWGEGNCAEVWTLFGIALLWDWENWPFPVLWPLLSFPNLLAYWVLPFHSIIFQDLK